MDGRNIHSIVIIHSINEARNKEYYTERTVMKTIAETDTIDTTNKHVHGYSPGLA